MGGRIALPTGDCGGLVSFACAMQKKARPFGPGSLRSVANCLEFSVLHNYILLMDVSSRSKFEPSKPIHRLDVVGISPESVEGVVGPGGDICVVANEQAVELIT